MKKLLIALLVLLTATAPAIPQSSPNLIYGQVPTAGQWNGYFQAKADYLGYTPLSASSVTATTPLTATPGVSSVNISMPNPLPVADGGTGIQIGTSGGVPYFASNTLMGSSTAGGANSIMLWGGAGNAPVAAPCTISSTTIIQCSSATSGLPELFLYNFVNDNTAGSTNFQKSRNGSAIQNGDNIGAFNFQGWSGSAYIGAASVLAFVNGTVSGSAVPAALEFSAMDASAVTHQMLFYGNGGPYGSGTLVNNNSIINQTTGGNAYNYVNDVSTGNNAGTVSQSNSINEWVVGKDGTNRFIAFDSIAGANAIQIPQGTASSGVAGPVTITHSLELGTPTGGDKGAGTVNIAGLYYVNGTQLSLNTGLSVPATRAGDIIYYNGSSWTNLAGNNSGTNALVENASGVPSWTSVGGTGTVTSVTGGTGLTTTSPNPITTTGTVNCDQATSSAFGCVKVDGTSITAASGVISAAASGVQGSFKNLSIKVATTTTVTIAADIIVMSNGSGGFQSTSINATCNLGASGAVNELDTGTIAVDTWYYIWGINNGSTTGCLASTSSTAPTMPGGYTYKARFGAVQTIHASATLYGTWQMGRQARYVVGLASTTGIPIMTSGTAGNVSTPTYVAISTVRFVPATASIIYAFPDVLSAASILLLAPNSSYGNNASTTNPPFQLTGYSGGADVESGIFPILLESTNIYWANNGAADLVGCYGWEDNI